MKHFLEGGPFDEAWIADAQAKVLAALAESGDTSAAELGDAVPALREQIVYAPGTAAEARQSVGSRLLTVMAMDGLIVRRARLAGSWLNGRHRWALAEPQPHLGRAQAQAELARRWLRAFGPATAADLKWWTGWTMAETRVALAAAGAAEVSLDEGTGHVLDGDLDFPEPEPWAALLPALDPTPMGWQARDWYLPESLRPALFDRSGNVGPTVWWNGQVVGGWATREGGEVVWRALTDVGAEAVSAVETEVAGLTAWLRGVRITPRFRTPLERELTA